MGNRRAKPGAANWRVPITGASLTFLAGERKRD